MSRGRLRAGATLVTAMLLLAACGGGEDETPSGATGSAAAATNQEAAAEVKTLLAGEVEFPMPTEAVDPGTHRVAVIASGLASPGPSVLAENAMDAIKTIGWTADPPGDGKFTPTTQAQLIEKAVLDKVDGIVLVSITPSAVAAAVKAADDAGIAVVCALCGPDLPEGMVGVGNDHKAAGRAQAAYAASLAKPGDTVVVYQNTEFKQSEEQMAEAAAAVRKMCPGCKVKTPSLLLAEAMHANAPIFTSLLNEYRKGTLSSVVVPFDSPAAVLANSAAQLGRDDFAVIGLGSLSPFVDMVGAGRPAVAKADVLISTPLYGWASVDQLARMLAGAKTWTADQMPVALVDRESYAGYEKGKLFVLPKFDYKAKFTELWGK
ncbi:substrate-binding domain-containing protein [Actinomadura viridis]|uniref:substrate-binding domain-containing protein n=1 Tax=Actinomadura viridis TaxID=58110 RepID=UPI0036CFABD2